VTEEDLETNEGEEVDLLTTLLDLSGWEVNDKEKEKELSSLLFDKDVSNLTTIPSQTRVTHQILSHCRPFQVLHQVFTVPFRVEYLRLRTQ
jgi:hypothetical protein